MNGEDDCNNLLKTGKETACPVTRYWSDTCFDKLRKSIELVDNSC